MPEPTTPQIGDKVTFINGKPGTVWADRTGIVVGLPADGDPNYEVYTPGHPGSPWWSPASKLRVIEHAAYQPPATSRADDPWKTPLDVLTVRALDAYEYDDEPVTVEGIIARIEHRRNEAGAPMVTLTLYDLDDEEITAKVDVCPSVLADVLEQRQQAGLPPLAVGDRVLVRGLTECRTLLAAHDVRLVGDWDGDTDPAVYAEDGAASAQLLILAAAERGELYAAESGYNQGQPYTVGHDPGDPISLDAFRTCQERGWLHTAGTHGDMARAYLLTDEGRAVHAAGLDVITRGMR